MWNDTIVAALKKHHEDGLSATEIALKLNARHGTAFSRNAVIGKLHRTGIVIITERKTSRPKGMRMERPKAGSIFKPARDLDAVRAVKTKFGEALVASKRKAPLAAPEPSTPPPAEGLTFMELELRHCRFPTGERDGQHIFCGATRKEGSAYCPSCHSRVYVPAMRSKNFKYRQPGATIEADE